MPLVKVKLEDDQVDSCVANSNAPEPEKGPKRSLEQVMNQPLPGSIDTNNLLPLLPQQAEKARFPPGCNVLHTNVTHSHITVTVGTVHSVAIALNLSNEFVYRITPQNKSDGSSNFYGREANLQFSPYCPVWVRPAHFPPEQSEVSAFVLESYQSPEKVLYSVQDANDPDTMYHGLPGTGIRYRNEEFNTETSVGRLSTSDSAVVPPLQHLFPSDSSKASQHQLDLNGGFSSSSETASPFTSTNPASSAECARMPSPQKSTLSNRKRYLGERDLTGGHDNSDLIASLCDWLSFNAQRSNWQNDGWMPIEALFSKLDQPIIAKGGTKIEVKEKVRTALQEAQERGLVECEQRKLVWRKGEYPGVDRETANLCIRLLFKGTLLAENTSKPASPPMAKRCKSTRAGEVRTDVTAYPFAVARDADASSTNSDRLASRYSLGDAPMKQAMRMQIPLMVDRDALRGT